MLQHNDGLGSRPQCVAISGASGFVGSRLTELLSDLDIGVRRIVRTPTGTPDDILWDPRAGTIDAAGFDGVDAVVHLAGENLMSGRWTTARKQVIRDSRVEGTALLARTLARRDAPPRVLVSASAIGIYGDRGAERLVESSPAGSGYLAELCSAWEQASRPASAAGIRTVNVRIGVVLGAHGGALGAMMTPFKLGLGGRIGNGRQYMSWIALDDLARVFTCVIMDPRIAGPINAVAPQPVTNAEFTRALGRVINRPTVLPMPAFMARAAFGEVADELLLASTRVLPRKLEDSGFEFLYPQVEDALRHELGA